MWVGTLEGHTEAVAAASFSHDGSHIVTGSWDSTAIVWDAATGKKQVAHLKGHTSCVTAASFNHDGSRIVTGSHDSTAIVWDAATGKQVAHLKGHTSRVTAASFNHDGSRIVTGSDDKTAIVWDAATGKQVAHLKGHASCVYAASFSHDGSRIVTGSHDSTAIVWDAATGKQVAHLKGHTQAVTAASFSHDGSRIVTGSQDKTAIVWDAATGEQVAHLKSPYRKGHTQAVTAASFNHDGSRIVTGSWDNTAIVWDAATGKQVAHLKGHTDFVFAASFSHDGSRIVTGSRDKTAIVWDRGKEELSSTLAITASLIRTAAPACGDSWLEHTNPNGEPIKALLELSTIIHSYGTAANGALQGAQATINKYADAVRKTVIDLCGGSDLKAVVKVSDAASKLSTVHDTLFGPDFKPALELRYHREALGVGYGTNWDLPLKENIDKAKLAGLLDGKGSSVDLRQHFAKHLDARINHILDEAMASTAATTAVASLDLLNGVTIPSTLADRMNEAWDRTKRLKLAEEMEAAIAKLDVQALDAAIIAAQPENTGLLEPLESSDLYARALAAQPAALEGAVRAAVKKEYPTKPAVADQVWAALNKLGIEDSVDFPHITKSNLVEGGVPALKAERLFPRLQAIVQVDSVDHGVDATKLLGPSAVDIWSDLHPPLPPVTSAVWCKLRNTLWYFGRPFKGTPADRRFRVFRCALGMNQIQQLYRTSLFTVGGQGRLLAERTIAFIDPSLKGKLADNIATLHAAGSVAATVKDALHELRKFGNRTDHDSLADLRPNEKPKVVEAAYTTMTAVAAVCAQDYPAEWAAAGAQAAASSR